MKKYSIFILVLIGLFVLAACTITQEPVVESANSAMADTPGDDDEMTAELGHDVNDDDDMTAVESQVDAAESEEMAGEETMSDMADLPAWQEIELTDARTGEVFSLASFSGQTIFVEPMATWCTNCRRQLGNASEARNQVGDDVVFIGLSLETTLEDSDLAQYQGDYGFDWTFAVMTPEMLQSLADTFGRGITSAPSTPHFIIRPDGTYTDLVTGIEPAGQIVNQIQAAGG